MDKINNKYIYIVLIITITVITRIFRLDFQSLWGDELYSLIPTHPFNSLASVIEYSKSDQPPLYFILLHSWFKIVPYNEYMGRFLSVIFGIAGVVAMYFLGREFKNENVGLVASIITSINYFHIYYSQELRFYSLLFLMSCLSYWYFLKCFKNPTLINYILYCIFSIGLIYTHYFGPCVIVAQAITFIILLFTGIHNKKFIVYSILSGILILLAYIPWIPILIRDTGIKSIWIAKPSAGFIGLYYYMYLGKDPFLAILFLFFLFLFVRQFFLRNNSIRYHTESPLFIKSRFIILAVWIFIGYFIPYIYSISVLPILEARYTLIVVPALFIVFSIGFTLIEIPIWRRILIASIFISSCINFLFFNKYYSKIIKDQYREGAQVVIDNYKSPIKVYSSLAYFYNYYFQKANLGNLAVNPTIWYPGSAPAEANFEETLAHDKEIWIMQGGALAPMNDEQQAYINTYFNIKHQYNFKGAYVILYNRKEDRK